MKITIITGSGHRDGASLYLADEFSRGACESGNEVFQFNAGFKNISPCLGCRTCRKTYKCIFHDSFDELAEKILESDLIVWVTPVYYMTMTSQLKTVIDRMYQLETNSGFRNAKNYILLAVAWDSNPNVFNVLKETFNAFCKFLRWKKIGEVLAYNVDTRADAEKSKFGYEAYLLGKGLKSM